VLFGTELVVYIVDLVYSHIWPGAVHCSVLSCCCLNIKAWSERPLGIVFIALCASFYVPFVYSARQTPLGVTESYWREPSARSSS